MTCNTLQHSATLQHMGLMKTSEKKNEELQNLSKYMSSFSIEIHWTRKGKHSCRCRPREKEGKVNEMRKIATAWRESNKEKEEEKNKTKKTKKNRRRRDRKIKEKRDKYVYKGKIK